MGVLDYTGAIKITFDRPIINDPEVCAVDRSV